MVPGVAIGIIRRAKNIKQKDFASLIGVTPSYLSLIESGKKDPSYSLIKKSAENLRIPLVLLLQDEDNESDSLPPDLRNSLRKLFYDILSSAGKA